MALTIWLIVIFLVVPLEEEAVSLKSTIGNGSVAVSTVEMALRSVIRAFGIGQLGWLQGRGGTMTGGLIWLLIWV